MVKKQTFEASLKKLESIVSKLESGSLNLDEMFKLFKEGISLTRNCRNQLQELEEQFNTIVKDNENYIEKPGIQ